MVTDPLAMLLMRIKDDTDPVWTRDRVKALLGSETSADTCNRLLRRAERMRVLVQREDGTWIRATWLAGAQRDWYS